MQLLTIPPNVFEEIYSELIEVVGIYIRLTSPLPPQFHKRYVPVSDTIVLNELS